MAPKFSKHGSWRGFRKTQLQAVERWQGDRDLLPFGCQHTVLHIPAMKPVEPLGQVRVPYARPAPHVTIIRTRIVYLFSERRKAMQKRIASLPLPSQISNSTARVRSSGRCTRGNTAERVCALYENQQPIHPLRECAEPVRVRDNVFHAAFRFRSSLARSCCVPASRVVASVRYTAASFVTVAKPCRASQTTR